jgi:hypothetical protein
MIAIPLGFRPANQGEGHYLSGASLYFGSKSLVIVFRRARRPIEIAKSISDMELLPPRLQPWRFRG